MLCKKCNTENLLKADYCQSCGEIFTKEEKDAAYEKTIFGKFEKAEKYISYLKPVEIIKGNKFFRIGVLVLIILYSIFMTMTKGNYIRVEESNSYELLYNKDLQAYYIVSDSHSVDVQMHIPAEADYLTILTMDKNDAIINSRDYSLDVGVFLEASDNYHYIIMADCGDETQSIAVYVVMG